MMVKLTAQAGGPERELTVEPLAEGSWRVVIAGVERVVEAQRAGGQAWSLLVDGQVWNVDLEPNKDGDFVAEVRGRQVTVKLLDARRRLLEKAQAATRGRGAAGPLAVRAPMPGKVVKVLVKAGDAITANAGLVVVEAMKMENELKAPRDGTVEKVHVGEGQSVEANATLITLG